MADLTRRQQIFKSMRTQSTLDGVSDQNTKRRMIQLENSNRNENGLNRLKSMDSGDENRMKKSSMKSSFLIGRVQNEITKTNTGLQFSSLRLIAGDKLSSVKSTSVLELESQIQLFKEKSSDHTNMQSKRQVELLSKLSSTRSEKLFLHETFAPPSRQQKSNIIQNKAVSPKEHKRDYSTYSGFYKQQETQEKINEPVVTNPIDKQEVKMQKTKYHPSSNIKESAVIETIKVNHQGQKTVRFHFIKPEKKIEDRPSEESSFRRSPRMKLKDYLHMAENSARRASIEHSSKNKLRFASPNSKFQSQTTKHKSYKEEKYKITNKQMLVILQQQIEVDLQSVAGQVKRIQTFLSDMVRSDIGLNDDELLILYNLRHEIKQKMILNMKAAFQNPQLVDLVERSRTSLMIESQKISLEDFSMPNECQRSGVSRHS